MSDNHESVAAKLRKISEWAENNLRDYGADWREHNKLCDMLKKALAAEDVGEPVGNAAKMREALEKIAAVPMPPPIDLAIQCAVDMRDIAIAALASPPRNCDVGTAEEHEDRYEAFCAKHFARDIDRYDNPCGSCPLASQVNLCKLAWAQMPYEKGDTDGSK